MSLPDEDAKFLFKVLKERFGLAHYAHSTPGGIRPRKASGSLNFTTPLPGISFPRAPNIGPHDAFPAFTATKNKNSVKRSWTAEEDGRLLTLVNLFWVDITWYRNVLIYNRLRSMELEDGQLLLVNCQVASESSAENAGITI